MTDRDTIRAVAGGRDEPVRLILIDTPETNDPDDPTGCDGTGANRLLRPTERRAVLIVRMRRWAAPCKVPRTVRYRVWRQSFGRPPFG